jgi:hypothetical protein
MSSRLAVSIAVLTAGVGLTACGSSSKTTVTQTVTTTVANAGRAATGKHSQGATPAKHAGSGSGTSTAGKSSPTPSQGGSGGGGSTQPTSTSSGGTSAAPLTRHVVDNVETVHITSRQGPLIIQEGVVTGSPFGRGTIVLHNRLNGTGVVSAFEVKGGAGSVRGLGSTVLQVQGARVHYRGTARLIGGTGAYSRVRAAHLTVSGSGTLSGNTTLHVKGIEWY